MTRCIKGRYFSLFIVIIRVQVVVTGVQERKTSFFKYFFHLIWAFDHKFTSHFYTIINYTPFYTNVHSLLLASLNTLFDHMNLVVELYNNSISSCMNLFLEFMINKQK